MEKIEELVKEAEGAQKQIKRAHEAIDDFYCHGMHQMGFGPMVQSDIIAGCNARLQEIKGELVKLGLPVEAATELCRDSPPSGQVYEACLSFIAKHS